ncbi:MAG TPA: ABC transporter substrate-binding protein [Baekduia sp.]|uniref:ABC transporter substrate-binding protein n=1 Tax=Baekduia sp. TaxID=2600305 RepID=UPI002D766709|nr:ABC transporter substrate-binding protein [Baekduia sp.]HET6509701.1 ABC transporter substrate-binding protein [Baekduia sp.]
MARRSGAAVCAVMMAAALAAAGCGGTTPVGGASDAAGGSGAGGAGTVRVAISSGISTYDPALACTTQYEYAVVKNTYDTLVQYSASKGADGRRQIVPDLAKSWSVSKDGLRYTFRLRDDVTFASGNPMTSADVVYGLERVLEKQGCQAYVLTLGDEAAVKSIAALGKYAVRITLAAKNPIFLGQLTQTGLSPVDRKLLTQHGGLGKAGDAWLARHTAGTGAYTIAPGDDPDSEIDLVARKGYWQGTPKNDRVSIKVVTDPTTLETLVRANELDMAYGVPAKDTKSISQGRTLVDDIGPFFIYLGMNNAVKPFDDVRVRQAVALALDRNALVAQLGYGQVEAFDGPMPPAMPYSPKLEPGPPDVAQAKRLVAAAGAKGSSFTLDVKSGEAFQQEVATILQASLKQIGIAMKIHTLGASAFIDRVSGFKSQAYLIRDGSPFNDPAYFLGFFVKCGNLFNWTKYCNKQVDALLEQGRTETDEAKRTAEYAQLSEIVTRERPMIPMFALGADLIASKSLTGYTTYDDQQPVFWPISAG